ncbi:MAG: Acyltransferase family protein [Phycisphaerales bacterium]|nr:Acyltransferase family protein [Phycisphaerales bacterium]
MPILTIEDTALSPAASAPTAGTAVNSQGRPPRLANGALGKVTASDKTPPLQYFLHLYSLLAVLVILLHSSGQPRPDEGPRVVIAAWNYVNGVIGVLRMPLFFFASGYLFMHTNPSNKKLIYREFVRKKVGRLLLPYFAISSMAFPIKAYLGGRALRAVHFSAKDYVLSLVYPARNPIAFFWFVAALFVISLTAPAIRRIVLTRGKVLIAVLTAALLALRWQAADLLPGIFGFDVAGSFLFYFWVGALAWRYRARWSVNPMPIVAIIGIAAVILWYTAARDMPHIRWMASLPGIYAAYYLMTVYISRGWRFLHPLEGKTYPIYLLAWFPQQFVIVVLYKSMHVNYWVCVLLTFLGGLLLPLLAARLVARFLPRLSPLIGLKDSRSQRAGGSARHLPPTKTTVTAFDWHGSDKEPSFTAITCVPRD